MGLDNRKGRQGKFSVKSFYSTLDSSVIDPFPHKPVRKLLNKILNVDNLIQRGWSLINRCSLCYIEEENVDHLFVQFLTVRKA